MTERPSTVSELENCSETEFDMDSSRVLSTCQSNTSNVPSISEINDSIASPTPGPRIISRVPVIVDESDDDRAYSDDFDSEPENRPTPLSLTDSSVAPLSNLVSNKRCNGKRSDRSEKTRGSTQERRNAHKSERKTDPRLSKTTISVEVQTAWTGDFISGYTNLTPSGQIPYPMSNDTPELTQTRLQPTPIIRTAVNGKALQTLTEHNPCIVALDNMLKQQVNITRDFLATQRQLHNAISTALSRCLTTDYITWGNTAQILRSGGLP
ncbi:hypothetical protein FGIG_12130 [Fasciola gigantica]|uniref:DUF4614 domain-containing protein n=1 Tax=Fasciola gigantica TaxID=46835 RepID=A0A504YU81_FASGI|nr:hypothetical protein FGIG_12130 [Fasciola gigantica]